MSITKEINKGFISANDPICISIEGICNQSHNIMSDVIVNISTPLGLEFVSANLPRGIYDETTGIWTIGDMYVMEEFSGDKTPTFCYRVSDCTDIDGNPLDDATVASIEDGSYTGVLDDLRTGDCFIPYIWNVSIETPGCIDCNPNDNSYCIIVDGISCCEVKECITSGKLNCQLLTP
jgi:hypothetical protein